MRKLNLAIYATSKYKRFLVFLLFLLLLTTTNIALQWRVKEQIHCQNRETMASAGYPTRQPGLSRDEDYVCDFCSTCEPSRSSWKHRSATYAVPKYKRVLLFSSSSSRYLQQQTLRPMASQRAGTSRGREIARNRSVPEIMSGS